MNGAEAHSQQAKPRAAPGPAAALPCKGASAAGIEEAVTAILAEATLEEKVGMMSGRGFFASYTATGGVWGADAYRAGSGIERLRVPALFFTDGPRGVARGNSTCFPCSMARGASFDPDLEHRIGQIMGIEARAQGCNLSGAVCFNVLRHPAWGRAQETYGEDPWHLGVMGAALGTGIQTHNVIATVKHYALNSMENARFTVDVRIDERALHEIYLPHFRFALDAGVASVMSAYNKVNEEYCGQHHELLTNILRGEWGFGGFVHSDWIKGVYHPYGAAAGLDVENPEPIVFGAKLVSAVREGAIAPHVLDTACRRILATQFRFLCAEDPLPDYPMDLVACDAHVAVALEAAEKSAVLLENDGILPFDRDRVRKLAVLGRLAAIENTGDNGSSRVRPPSVVTAIEGLKRHLGADAVLPGDESDLPAARATAGDADAVVVVVGYTAEDEGEFLPGDIALGENDGPEKRRSSRPIGGDRLDLELPAAQVALIEAAAESGKPVVVVIVAGSAVLIETWRARAGAILQTFYAGMEGGTALARLLFGAVSPSGKLPFTVARNAAHYPFFDRDADAIDYDYWHGYAKFEREALNPRYPFGHGLSYASFAYRAATSRIVGDRIETTVAVRNDGTVTADEVVQLYVAPPARAVERWPRMLRAFRRVTLTPGETGVVRLAVPLESLRYRDPAIHGWRQEPGTYRLMLGGSSATSVETMVEL